MENLSTKCIKITEPSVCPCCGGKLIHKINADGDEGIHLYCTNKDCEAKVMAKLNYFVSKDCMDIECVSDKTIAKLYAKGYVKKWQDLYALSIGDLRNAECGEENSVKIFNNIAASKNREADRVLRSLGIPCIGKVVSKSLLESFGSIKAVVELAESSPDELKTCDALGEVACAELVKYIRENGEEFRDLFGLLNFTYISKKVLAGESLSGMTVLATGTLKNFSRDGIKESVESNGGKYASGVSKKLTFMIVGDAPGESKVEKAKSLGIKMISEDEYMKLI